MDVLEGAARFLVVIVVGGSMVGAAVHPEVLRSAPSPASSRGSSLDYPSTTIPAGCKDSTAPNCDATPPIVPPPAPIVPSPITVPGDGDRGRWSDERDDDGRDERSGRHKDGDGDDRRERDRDEDDGDDEGDEDDDD